MHISVLPMLFLNYLIVVDGITVIRCSVSGDMAIFHLADFSEVHVSAEALDQMEPDRDNPREPFYVAVDITGIHHIIKFYTAQAVEI